MDLNSESRTGLSEDKGRRILEAAKLLFAKEGLRSTSIEDIASKAGLGKGTVYLYFKSKEDIFSTLATSFAADLHAALEGAQRTPATSVERIMAHISTRVRFWERSYREYRLTVQALLEASSTSIFEGIRKSYEGGDVNCLKEILDEGVKNGEFSFSDTYQTAFVIYSMLDSLTRPWGFADMKVSADEKIQIFSDLLFNGLSLR